ncbi:AtpZ/AtpI family protein [Paenibacillus mucilaginosus]|uniref:Uncharacterized protein n=3 Tax=Paenibacillus mucilaginosus TaxID=61624 RepID=H6NT20_9BACL|nr:AtpZ/AtpI family protein [Paenibacillus mucilaginosus]AFC27033.1 hypothetical protein PM3016_44 [Paenibacillus mucilaginosus 3016]AFH59166.1 hypothetical protein B2K_00205 [Paenibacillus mucilaginosus K02]MCG7215835.1 AtpZ/AtpI family protein [Paenibacillus mucilaginosus]WDM27784.1 AtpZ/AtpI family protein [Paenibacillus mucilaginosus]WFA15969.1 AtpZ/AtpI family protein [Paenibacillus mucilaginosus]
MKRQNSNDSPWRALALLGGIGVDLGVCMAAGYWVGDLISEWQGGEPLWIVGGMMTGFILGIASIYLIIRNYMRGGPNG